MTTDLGAYPDSMSGPSELTTTQAAASADPPEATALAGREDGRHAAPSRRPGAVRRAPRSDVAWLAAGALALLVLCVAYTYPLALNLGSAFAYNSGDTVLVTWQFMWNWHALLHDPASLTNPNIFYPVTGAIFFTHLLLPPTLLFGPIAALSGNPVLASNVVTIATLWLDGLLAGYLAWRWTGSRPAAAAGAAVGALNPLVIQRVPHAPLIMMWWTSAALICLDSYCVRPRLRTAVLTAVFLGLQFLTAVYLNFYAFILCGIYLIVFAWFSRARVRELAKHWRVFARHALVAGIVAAVLLVPPAVGYLDVAKTWGVQRTLDDAVAYSASPISFLVADPASLIYGSLPGREFLRQAPNEYEKYDFLGIVPLALAVLAVLGLRRAKRAIEERLRIVFSVVALGVGVVLALGPYLLWRGTNSGIPLPYLPLYEWFPGFQSMRVPSRFPLMAVPALAALAAFGVREIGRLAPHRPALTWGAVALVLVESLRAPIPLSYVYDRFDARDLAVLEQVQGPIAWFPIAWPGTFSPYLEAARMLQNTALVPMVNGYSGFVTPVYEDLQRLDATEPPAVVESVLAQMGVRRLIFDTIRMPAASVAEWRSWAIGRLEPLGPSGRLQALAPRSPSAVQNAISLELPNGRLPADEIFNLGFDLINDGPTPWVNGRLDGLRDARLRWQPVGGGTVIEEAARVFVPVYVGPQGRRSVRLEARTPATAGRYRLSLVLDGFIPVEREVEVVGHLPRTTAGPQPGLAAELSLTSVPPTVSVSPGARLRVAGIVWNRGDVVWQSVRSDRSVPGEVRIGYRWYPAGHADPSTEIRAMQGRIDALARDLAPGDSTGFSGVVNAPREPGEYEVHIAPVAENVAWFDDLDPASSPPIVIRVTVAESGEGRAAA